MVLVCIFPHSLGHRIDRKKERNWPVKVASNDMRLLSGRYHYLIETDRNYLSNVTYIMSSFSPQTPEGALAASIENTFRW